MYLDDQKQLEVIPQQQQSKFTLKINEKGELDLETSEVSQENLQAVLDTSTLRHKAYLQVQKERDKENNIYVWIASIFILFGLFTTSFAIVRSFNYSVKTSEVNYVRRFIS